jgi:transposase-like protein
MGKAIIQDWRLEVQPVKLKGKPAFMWKAVGADGELLDFYSTPTRDEAAARQFFEQSLKDPWPKTGIRSGTSTRRRK